MSVSVDARPETSHWGGVGAAAAVVAASAAGLSVLLPWLRLGVLSSHDLYYGTDVLAFAVPTVALALTLLVSAIAGSTLDDQRLRQAAVIAGVTLAVYVGALILLIECVSGLLPTSFLPKTITRVEFGVRALPGMWLAFAGAVVGTSALVVTWPQNIARSLWRLSNRLRSIVVFQVLVMTMLLVGMAWLRYVPWVEGVAGGESVDIQGWVVPGCGVLSLTAVGAVSLAAAAVLASRIRLGATVAAFGGWLMTLAAALTIITSGAISKFRFDAVAPERLQDFAPEFGTAPAAYAEFGLGLGAAAVAAALLIAVRRGEAA